MPRRSTLELNGIRVEMVEHVLAALAAMRIDNCEIWVDAPEMPGLDGSSKAFVEALDAGGFVLGGEQSGHIIFRDVATTGDGVLAALRTTELVRRSGRTIEALAASSMTRLPQTLVNVAISQPMPDVTERIAEALGAAAALLGTSGRVLVRPSGTEPVVRVMVEASDVDEATAVGRSLASAVETADLSRG